MPEPIQFANNAQAIHNNDLRARNAALSNQEQLKLAQLRGGNFQNPVALQSMGKQSARNEALATNQDATEKLYKNKALPGDDLYLNGKPLVAEKGSKDLNVNDFLKLLTVQFKNQDPMEPIKDTSFIAQMSSFSSLTQMGQLTEAMNKFTGEQRSLNYLGRMVAWYPDGDHSKPVTVGVVTSTEQMGNGQVVLSINGFSTDNQGHPFDSRYVAEVGYDKSFLEKFAQAQKAAADSASSIASQDSAQVAASQPAPAESSKNLTTIGG